MKKDQIKELAPRETYESLFTQKVYTCGIFRFVSCVSDAKIADWGLRDMALWNDSVVRVGYFRSWGCAKKDSQILRGEDRRQVQ